MSYYNYIAIFQTTLVKSAPSKIISNPAKIEFFNEERTYKVPIQTASILPKGADYQISSGFDLNVPAGKKYVSITIRTKESDPHKLEKYCEDNLNRTIANLSLLYGADLFAKQIYRGWLFNENKGVMTGWVRVQEPFDVIESDINECLKKLTKSQSADTETLDRFTVMSRFFAKSLLVHPGEEKLLYLWTILEVFPMKGTSNIKPISKFLGKLLNKPPELVKEKLGIGFLYGIRSNLVHDGKLDVPVKEMGILFTKLEKMCIEVLRSLSGIEYSGSLDEYFT